MIKQVDLLGSKVNIITAKTLKEYLVDTLDKNNKEIIVKTNTEFLLRAKREMKFQELLNSADLSIADGKGVLWAAKYLSIPLTKIPLIRQLQAIWQMKYTLLSLIFYPKYCKNPIPENIPGVDAMYLMLDTASDTSSSVYIFGGEKDVLEKAIQIIKKKYPKLNIAGYYEGFDYEDREIIKDINNSKAEFLFIALGSPKQEYWIRDNMDQLNTVKVAVGEGGSLDFIAGASKRAPIWMQVIGLEWLFRLFANKSKSHTGSRGKRVWNAVPVFILEVVKYKLGNK